jgi:hypothetical protein
VLGHSVGGFTGEGVSDNHSGHQLCNSVSSSETAFPLYSINEIFYSIGIIFSPVLWFGPENCGKKQRNSDCSYTVGRRESNTL